MGLQFAFSISHPSFTHLQENAQELVDALQRGSHNNNPKIYTDTSVADMQVRVFGKHRNEYSTFYYKQGNELYSFNALNKQASTFTKKRLEQATYTKNNNDITIPKRIEDTVIVGSILFDNFSYIKHNPTAFNNHLTNKVTQALHHTCHNHYLQGYATIIPELLHKDTQELYVQGHNDFARLGTKQTHKLRAANLRAALDLPRNP